MSVEDAAQALAAQDPARALQLVRVDAHTTDPRAAQVEATALLQLGRPDEALEALAAPSSAEASASTALLQCRAYLALGRPEQAVAAGALATRAAPESAAAAMHYGESLWRAERPHAALEELHRALELDDTVAGAWFRLARVYRHLEDLDNARFASEQAATLDPLDPAIQSLHATLLSRSGEVEAAARVLHAALQHYPSDPQLRQQLSELLDRPVSAAFLAWIALWMVLMGVSLLLGVALEPMVGGICFLFLLVGMVVWGASFSEDSDGSRLEQAVPGVTALVDQINADRAREERTRDNPWTPPEV